MQEQSLFIEALERDDPAERAAYLDRVCAADPSLRQRLERLLERHHQPDSFLGPAPALAATAPEAIRERPGTVIGPYKLMEQIGEGGMGLVFVAEQMQPVRRKVALKVIKPGMDTRQVISRFEAERQALALMDHPHIAKVLDGGATDSGRPYFVMELVKGVPITDFCDTHHLSVRQRLELFVSVCQAVQHAHQKGVIHRDLKPTNVLVTLHDNTPVVKVIDFGVAKAVGQQLTEKTVYTALTQMLGTPRYMSPEQAGMSGLDVDTRTDIYSLGVLLYELLTGTTPLQSDRLQQASFDEIRRIIREEEPVKPSTRISTLGQAAATVSANRQYDPKRLSQLFRGDLDWIVMTALEKDRNRRYETAAAFAADVQRYLHDEPVQACPPSAWYRFRKLARRNKGAFLTAGAVAAVVLLGIAGLTGAVLALREERNETQKALDGERQAKRDLEWTSYTQRIALAERQLSAGNVGRAEELLNQCPAERRGWEWHFLKRQRYGNAPPLEHPDTVHRVAFSQDGRRIATSCLDGNTRIWDLQTRRTLFTLRPESGQSPIVRALAYSPDGSLLAVAHQDGVVYLWRATTGERLAMLQGHNNKVWQVAFSPDGRTLASAGQDRTVRLWDVGGTKAERDRLVRVLSDHPADVKAVAFRPDGECLLAACADGTVKTWDVADGRELCAFRHQLQYVDNVRFSHDTGRLAWSCMDGVIKVWNTATREEEFSEQSNTGFGRNVTFSPDGRRLAVAGFDGTLRLLDAATGLETLTIYAHPSLAFDVAFTPDGRRLASSSYDYTLRIWDATPLTDDPLAPHCVSLAGHERQVYGVAFSPDGHWLASAGLDFTVKVWELAPVVARSPDRATPIALRYTLRGHSDNVIGVAFSPDGRTLASGSWDHTVKLWDLEAPKGETLTERGTIRFSDRVISVGFSPDGRLLAVGQPNGIALYDPAAGREVHPFKWSATPVPALVFHPDGRYLVSAAATDASLKVWDVAGQKPLFEIRHYSNPNSAVAISPDGRRVASAGRDHAAGAPEVKLWDVDWDGKKTATFRALKGHAGYVWRVAFSPDGRYLASGSWDSTVKIWEVATGKEVKTLRGHAGFIRSLAFSPDGRRLASASGYAGHGEVKVWDASLWENQASEER